MLADELDAEALRNSAGRELFTNPAKTIAARLAGRRVALAGDCAATLALARHGSSVLLRLAHEVVAATGLADAVRGAAGGGEGRALPRPRWMLSSTTKKSTGRCPSGCGCWRSPCPTSGRWWPPGSPGSRTSTCSRPRMCPMRPGGVGRLWGFAGAGRGPVSPEQQLAVLAVRLEMAAVYMRLVRG